MEAKERARGNFDNGTAAEQYRKRIEAELLKTCDEILKLIRTQLLPKSSNGENKVERERGGQVLPHRRRALKKVPYSEGESKVGFSLAVSCYSVGSALVGVRQVDSSSTVHVGLEKAEERVVRYLRARLATTHTCTSRLK